MRARITLSVDNEFVRWIDGKVDERTFANRSHAIELLIRTKITHETRRA